MTTIELYINNKKLKFFINVGWYRGEEFWLFKIGLFNKMDEIDTMYIVDLHILKFVFLFGFDWE